MKRALFDITDEEFATLLERTNDSFKEAGIPHMFVGGSAVQAITSSYLCEHFGMPLLDLANSDEVRVQDCLRATDDVDVALRLEGDAVEAGKKIYPVLNKIVGETFSPSEEHIVDIRWNRKGHVKPQFLLGIDDIVDPSTVVAFNLYRAPKDLKDQALDEFEERFYDIFLDRAVSVTIPYCAGKDITLRVKNPEDTLATKIVRGRGKDMSDALSLAKYSLMAGKPLDYRQVENTLCGKDKRYDVPNTVLRERYEAFKELLTSLPTFPKK